MIMTTTEVEECRLCGKDREEHLKLEAQHIINHQFSETGDVVPTDRSPKKKSKETREVMVLPSADILLRSLLVAKGILSESDLEDLGAAGYGSSGDREDRNSEGT